MSIFEDIKRAGAEIDHHETDLYVEDTPETKALVDNYEFKGNVKTFRNQLTGKMFYDIPFAYDPEWDKKRKGNAL